MMEILKKAKESKCDALVFIPKDDENTSIVGLQYNEKGDTIVGGCGDLYTIMLFKGEKDNYHSFEEFDAVLVCPFTYCDRMFNDAFYGIIAKKTSTSNSIIDMIRTDMIKEFNLE